MRFYGGITGNPDISEPVLPLPAISEPVIFPSVAFPPVILSPCAEAGIIIVVPTADVATAKIVAAINVVARRIPLFIRFIAPHRTINYIIVVYGSQSRFYP